MLSSTETLLEKGFGDQVFKEWAFAAIFKGSLAKKYAIMHKALKKGEITRLHRGVYILGAKYRTKNLNTFFIANRMITGSYVSAETALAFHGWIPERVNVIMSVIPSGRTKSINNMLGEFKYIKIVVQDYEFLSGVLCKELGDKSFLIASPLRALADYVYIRKIKWTTLNFLLESMRIETEHLTSLTLKDFNEVLPVYTSKRVLSFLKHLQQALGL
jgi:hypothetical protein